MKKHLIPALLLVLFLPGIIQAQSASVNTLKYNPDVAPPPATLESISWIEGHWKGQAFGGIAEEIWSPPLGGTMMFSYKLEAEDSVRFYEFGYVAEENGTLMLRFKHFHPDLKGWEEKDEVLEFPLVKIERKENRLYFDGFTFEKISED